jgi:outer membrane protein insertion porin family
MHKKFILLSSLALVAGISMHTAHALGPSTEAYESKTVGRITIQMENLPTDSSFDPKPVLSKMNTKIGDPFSQIVFDGDLKTLSDEYDRIEPSIETINGEVYITIKVWPRPTITAINWTGNTHISSKTLRKELGIKPKKVFNRPEFNKSFNKVKEYYVKKGYFESELSYTVVPDPKTNTVAINVTVKEGRSGIIDNIKFNGFTKKEKSQILDMIYTKKYNLFLSWLTGAGTYNEEMIEQDKLTIINFFQNKGYADVKIDIQLQEAKTTGKIIIVITAERGPIFHFGKVTFKGNTLFSDAEVEKVFLARPEGVYSPEKLRNTAQAIKDLYGRKGYIESNIQYETYLAQNAPIYNVDFEIEEGEQYKIGLIRIFGNVQTQTHVILRESLLVPGETFDSAKLKYTQQRLEQMGYFKAVNVYAVRTQDDQILGGNYRDVYIEVDETTTGNLSLFFGLSSNDGIFGGLDLAETNFNYKGFARLFKDGPSAMRGGGEYAHAKAQLGSKQRSYTISWLTPYFRDTPWRVGFDLFLSQSKLQAKNYEIDSFGGSLYASYPINVFWSFGWKYRFKHAKIDVSHGASRQEREADEGTGNVSATGLSLTFDSRDNIIKPHNGFRSDLETEYAGIFGDFAFFKYTYANAYYQQLWKRGIMKYRWDFRFIQPIWWTNKSEDIPVSERFFVGGENSVRGYKPFDIGEHFKKKNGERGDPMGGTSASVLSVEYLQEIFSLMDAFVFIDAGSVKLKKFHLSQYKMSYGFGVRLELMNRMPIIVGLGFPVNADKDTVQKFFFSMGGQF